MARFRVIVVGGGPAGLFAAHVLSQAGIDFVVLERRRDVVEDVGAGLILGPPSLRVLSQLGLLGRLQSIGCTVEHVTTSTAQGCNYSSSDAFLLMGKNHGCPPIAFPRVDLLRELFNGLTDEGKSRIHTSKQVVGIQSGHDGVKVSCDDGTIYEGSIVMGADGAHSLVRQQMRNLALAKSPKANVNEEKPFVAEYKLLWCSTPPFSEFAHNKMFEVHGKDISIQLYNRPEMCFLFMYERLKEPTKERTLYTQADIEQWAEKWAEVRITENVRVKDIFPTRFKAGMVNLEEGVLRHWSWERLVLVGDAVRKHTPNSGSAYNNGLQDIVVLANGLHRALLSSPNGDSLSQEQLTTVFSQYQSQRFALAEKSLAASALMIRMTTWKNWFYWLFDRYILPMFPSLTTSSVNKLSAIISQTNVLDFIRGEEPFEGTIPWAHRIPALKPKDAASSATV